MTNEEMQSTMQFILEQQAHLTVSMDKLTERIDGLAERIDGLAERMDKLTDGMDGLTEKVDRLAENADRLAEAQLKSESRVSRLEQSFLMLVEFTRGLDERQDTLTAQLAETDKRLNSLINTVERYISRDGK